jgi:hypothetical protein
MDYVGWILLFFLLKHLIVDFMLQTPYQFLNKGIYGHPGGLLHAGLHSLATFLILISTATLAFTVIVSLIDGIVHYHVDWSKVNITKRMGWTMQDQHYWYILGIDQFLHYLTYWAILVVMAGT